MSAIDLTVVLERTTTIRASVRDVEITLCIASDEDVAQAETQLAAAEAQATNLGILRAQLEHAIALQSNSPLTVSLLPA